MKLLNKLGLLLVSTVAFVSCVDNEPEIQDFPDADVDFTYNVVGEDYTIDYYVVSTIQFNNISAKSGSVEWNFGDGSTSNESNPTYKYSKSGLYNVTLTINATDGQKYTRTYPLLIYDIVPKLTVAEQSTEIVEINTTSVLIGLELPNPEGYKVEYKWTFPEGTTNEDGQEMTSWTGYGQKVGEEYVIDNPGKLKFKHIGSQQIIVETKFDVDREGGENRDLESSYINVQVGCNYEAPTLYYAKVDGNIMALKIVDENKVPAGTKVYPFDMGVKSGSMPKNICYGEYTSASEEGESTTQKCIFILDAGKQYYYVNDEADNMGDGKITAMNLDGTGVNVVVSNEGQQAFMDPYHGYVYNEELYYSDRGNGVSKIALKTRGAVETQDESDASFRATSSYVFENDLIPYYGMGIAYGAISAGHLRDSKGVWWWAKDYNGTGIYRIREGKDIYTDATEAKNQGAAGNRLPIVLSGIRLTTFTIDETRGALYAWRKDAKDYGFYHYALPGDTETGNLAKPIAKVAMDADAVNTTSDEGVHTTQFALDETTGRVYFAFRAASGEKDYESGIYYYDPETKKCVSYGVQTGAGYGITINPTLSKLF